MWNPFRKKHKKEASANKAKTRESEQDPREGAPESTAPEGSPGKGGSIRPGGGPVGQAAPPPPGSPSPAGGTTGAPPAYTEAGKAPPPTPGGTPASESTPVTTGPTSGAPVPQRSRADLERHVVDILKTCYDPEIPVNIYDLGLIYDVQVEEGGKVDVTMTLTSPACPVAGSLPPEVEGKIRTVPGVTEAKVEVTWDPPWSPSKMSESARLQLNM